MKLKYFLLMWCIVIYQPFPVEARNLMVVGGGVPSVGCSTPTDGTVHEGFEGAGYENTWSETGTPNEDADAPGSPPTGACSQSFSYTTNNAVQKATFDTGSSRTDLSFKVSFYVDSWPDPFFDSTWLLEFNVGAWPWEFVKIFYINGTGNLTVETGSTYNMGAVSTDTWHTLECHIPRNAAGACRLDGGADVAVTGKDQGWRYIYIGSVTEADGGGLFYLDNLQVNYDDAYID